MKHSFSYVEDVLSGVNPAAGQIAPKKQARHHHFIKLPQFKRVFEDPKANITTPKKNMDPTR